MKHFVLYQEWFLDWMRSVFSWFLVPDSWMCRWMAPFFWCMVMDGHGGLAQNRQSHFTPYFKWCGKGSLQNSANHRNLSHSLHSLSRRNSKSRAWIFRQPSLLRAKIAPLDRTRSGIIYPWWSDLQIQRPWIMIHNDYPGAQFSHVKCMAATRSMRAVVTLQSSNNYFSFWRGQWRTKLSILVLSSLKLFHLILSILSDKFFSSIQPSFCTHWSWNLCANCGELNFLCALALNLPLSVGAMDFHKKNNM